MSRIERNGLQVASELVAFVEEQALPGTGVSKDAFWAGLSGLVDGMGDENRALLIKRAEIQGKIDSWHLERP